MTPSRAIEIIEALAQGEDPYSGQRLSNESVFERADTVRALFLAVEGLQKLHKTTKRKSSAHRMTGQAWVSEEEQRLIERFESKVDVKEIAKEFERSEGAIWARLIGVTFLVPLRILL